MKDKTQLEAAADIIRIEMDCSSDVFKQAAKDAAQRLLAV